MWHIQIIILLTQFWIWIPIKVLLPKLPNSTLHPYRAKKNSSLLWTLQWRMTKINIYTLHAWLYSAYDFYPCSLDGFVSKSASLLPLPSMSHYASHPALTVVERKSNFSLHCSYKNPWLYLACSVPNVLHIPTIVNVFTIGNAFQSSHS